MNQPEADKLVDAALSVVTAFSVEAAKKPHNATHGIYRGRLVRLLEALNDVPLRPSERLEVSARLVAEREARKRSASWRAQHLTTNQTTEMEQP